MQPVLKQAPQPSNEALTVPLAPEIPSNEPETRIRGGLLNVARFEDLARRVIMGQSSAEIAADLGLSDRQVRRLLLEPTMQEIYNRVQAEFYADLDKIILDEKIQPLRRAHAQAIRAQTLVSEIIDEVRERIRTRSAKATDLKVGADAAFGIIDRAKGPLSTAPGADRGGVHIEFNLSADKTALLRSTIAEAGLDLSDLGIIDVEPVIDSEPEDPPADETQD